MTQPSPLRKLAARLREQLAGLPTDRPITITLPLPFPFRPAGLEACETGVLWQSREEDVLRIASGWAPLAVAAGAGRFRRLEAARRRLQRCWSHRAPVDGAPGPQLFCGFAFDPEDPCGSRCAGLPNTLLALPEVLIERRNGQEWIHFSSLTVPPSNPSHLVDHWLYRLRPLLEAASVPAQRRPDEVGSEPLRDAESRARWRRRVQSALAGIAERRFDKVVLSRTARVRLPDGFRLGTVLERLVREPGRGTAFAVRQGGQTLLGISPETLVRIASGRIRVEAVGGTTERRADPGEDARQEARLHDETKLLREHRLVVEDVLTRLAPLCEGVFHPSSPGQLTLADVRHLHTPIEARARPGVSLLALADALHPTAATGGVPRHAALEWMRRHGEHRRGWYTGALGWLTAEGDGELTVILRCGVLGQQEARLHAGAGIVAGSDPGEEYLETEWKLRTLARLLRTEADSPDHRQECGGRA